MIPNEANLLAQLEEAPTLWAAADIADKLAFLGDNEAYPVMARTLRRFSINTYSKPPRIQDKPRLHTNQQILDASLTQNFEGITEEGLLEAVTAALWANPAASIAAARLAEINPAYAVLPRVVSPWVTRP